MKFITTADPEYLEERKLRSKVLREPLGMEPGAEIFPFEDQALHLVAIADDHIVGCVMFNPEGTSGRMLQMAIHPDHQGFGIGTKLAVRMEERLRSDGFHDVYTHARHYAVSFYQKLGYAIEGGPFMEIGLEHRLMRKKL